jgi:hypothetical protein
MRQELSPHDRAAFSHIDEKKRKESDDRTLFLLPLTTADKSFAILLGSGGEDLLQSDKKKQRGAKYLDSSTRVMRGHRRDYRILNDPLLVGNCKESSTATINIHHCSRKKTEKKSPFAFNF